MTAYSEDLRQVALPSLDKLRGCNILVTGATGLIGGCLVDLLLVHADKIGYDVYAGCRSEDRFNERFNQQSHLHFQLMDVTRPVQSDVPFHYIVHAASGANPSAYLHDPVV